MLCPFSYTRQLSRCSRHGFRPSGKIIKISKGAKIRSRYNQVPHPTEDTNGKVTNSQLDTTNERQEVSPFPEGDHKAQINRVHFVTDKSKDMCGRRASKTFDLRPKDSTPKDWKGFMANDQLMEAFKCLRPGLISTYRHSVGPALEQSDMGLH